MLQIEVTKEHMDALKALSEVNLKVSEARNLLIKIQEEETDYLVSREKKAVERIQNTLILSHNLVEETNKNYEIIEQFGKDVAEGAQILAGTVSAFQALSEFKEKFFKDWERDIKNQKETISSLLKGLKIREIEVNSSKSVLEAENKELQDKTRKFIDEKGIVERQIMRLKENRI